MFGERWKQILSQKGGQPAIWHPEGALSFQELETQARALSPLLCPMLGEYYLAQGDGIEVTVALLAGFLAGRPVQVVEKDRQRRVPTAMPASSKVALIKQTVGSSGVRRCQFFSLEQIAADVGRLHAALGLHLQDVALAPLSVAHSFGLTTTVLQTLLHGLPTHWLPTPFPTGMIEALAQHERVFLPGVPAMWKAWLISGLDLSRVSLAVSAGSSLSLDLENRVMEVFGLKLHNLYGTSECGAISYDAASTTRTDARDLGDLLPNIQVHTTAEGRLRVISDAGGIGYDEMHAGEVFLAPEHLTWDVIEVSDGRLTLDRCVGAGINVASRKLSPGEICGKIREATGISQVTISGTPSRDPERVQDVVCTIGIPQAELTHDFKARACAALAPWEVPRRWVAAI
ncbi:MAG: AMP-binding protein [Verrucomicrobiota bacterium]